MSVVAKGLGVVLIAAAVAAFLLRGSLLANSPLVGLAVPLLGGVGGALLVWGRRLGALSADDAMARDPRPPVVYLRSFRDDGEMATSHGALVGFPAANAEQVLGSIMKRIGPFIAIGKPGEKMPELGAARMYVDDADWQGRIDELLGRAALVLLRTGSTEGFWWEVRRVADTVSPERLLFFLHWQGAPEAREAQYRAFRERAGADLSWVMPERLGDACFLRFEPDWQPELFGAAGQFAKAVYYGKPDYVAAELGPLLSRFGVEVAKPRAVSRAVWVLCGVLLALGGLLLAAILLGW